MADRRLCCLSRWAVVDRRLCCLSRWVVVDRRLCCLSRWVVAGREPVPGRRLLPVPGRSGKGAPHNHNIYHTDNQPLKCFYDPST